MINFKSSWIWIMVGGLLLFMASNYHSKVKPFTHQSQIWADKAGYQVYLPYTFIYQGEAKSFPDSIDFNTGEGFAINKQNNTVNTKYTSGVAILQAPFFLSAHLYASSSLTFEADGYSLPYMIATDIAAIFYCSLGLFLLFLILKGQYANSKMVILALLTLLFGTNLIYYSIDETGMSHVYSFFLFALFLYGSVKTQFLQNANWKWFVILGLTAGLIILIRPINILILSAFFLWKTTTLKEIKERFIHLIQAKTLISIICALIVWIPQMLFWKKNAGKWFYYSYGEEGFNFLKPKFWEVLFSAKYGAFVYGPILLIIAIWLVSQVFQKRKQIYFYLFVFLMVAYITASWHFPEFGCSYGVRNYVEYMALFAFPIAGLFHWVSSKSLFPKVLFSTLIVSLLAYNISMVYAYGGCSFMTNHWDYSAVVQKAFSF